MLHDSARKIFTFADIVTHARKMKPFCARLEIPNTDMAENTYGHDFLYLFYFKIF